METLPLNYPLFDFDNSYKEPQKTPIGLEIQTYDSILGTDEAGRGCCAGSVFCACVMFFEDVDMNKFQKLTDSKKLSEKVREELYDLIIENSYYSVVEIPVEKIEEINILNASLLGMKKACYEVLEKHNALSPLLLVDGNKNIKELKIPQKYIIKGDSKSASIAAASILAKVSRDRYMKELDKKYPQYLWSKNKGYLTKEHINAIEKYGKCEFHRLSFLKNY